MKRILAAVLLTFGSGGATFAQAPVANYQWDFNLTNSAAGTNIINSTIPGGDLQGPDTTTQQGILGMYNTAGAAANLLGLPGSGVGTNIYDRALLLAGSMGGNGPLSATLATANAITNLGVLTSFTLTAWVKADSALSGFPRIFEMGPQGADAGGLNNVSLLFFTGNTIQLKIHGYGGNGMPGPAGLLTSGLSDWVFLAVTYDATVDIAASNNVYFYSGSRFNTLGAGTGGAYGSLTTPPTVNSVYPASTNGVGFVNFSSGTNGDGTYTSASNAWIYIGNNAARSRAFNGRYDDIRLFANQVLNQTQLDAVRLDARLPAPQRLTVTNQPQSTTVAEGQGASFTVGTTPAPNETYQWYRFNPGSSVSNAIAGATNQIYETLPLTVASDNGAKYMVRVYSTDPYAGYNGAGTNSLTALATVVAANALVITPGMLKFEYFANAGSGSSVDNFLNAPSANYTNNTPDLTMYLSSFDSRGAFPDDSHFNYFVRISGSITPTVTTNYVFFIRAGDQAEFYLSTDGGASSNVLCADAVNGPQLFNGPETSTAFTGVYPGGQFSAPVALTAGTSYPVTVFLKQSSGVGLVQVAWRMDSGAQDLPANDANLADRLQPIPAAVLSTTALPGGTVAISSSPANANVVAGSKATFTVNATTSFSTSNYLSGPTVIQWQKNGVNISGATGATYMTPYLTTADNGAQFSATVSIPGVFQQSSSALLAVVTDNVKPAVISALADDSGHGINVQFSEPVDAATALNPANYSIPGLTIVGVNFVAGTNLVDNPSYDAVKLMTTNALADNTTYTVTVSNVKDMAAAPNTMGGTGNTATFCSMGLYPGVVKFEYFEDQTYASLAGLDVNGFVTYSQKFTNNDPDTVVFPASAEMSPDGTPTIRSAQGGNSIFAFPPQYGTRLSTIFVAPATTNYVFYMAANETGLLWLSTDENSANKHVIAWQSAAAAKRNWSQNANAHTDTFPTNLVGTSVTVPNATSWPTADANGFATISLIAGQRYFLELDHLENAGYDSYAAVTYTTAADNTTVTAPANGSAPALTGSVIGWRFPLPQITSFSTVGNAVSIVWTNSLNQINLGALGYPGLGSITAAFPSAALQSASVVSGPYTTLTNTSPATIPATGPAQFFRIGE